MSVTIEGLSKSYGVIRVVEGLNVSFREGKISVLLGSSGCGKTTTLRCIAGLEDPNEGEILIKGQAVYSSRRNINLQPEKRRLGMVFQSYAIWPHMTVFENVALPLMASKKSVEEINRRVEETISLVGLDGLATRSATQLSGGQQQRVAIARCLANQPNLILLDEPLSNLDAKLRVTMRQELRELQRRLGSTMIFVTHDQEEAMSLADEIFLFRDGKIAQQGTPEDLYMRPTNRYVAEFLGKANIIKVEVVEVSKGIEVTDRGRSTIIALDSSKSFSKLVGPRLCMIRPEAWQIGQRSKQGIQAKVEQITYLGGRRELRMSTPIGEQLVVTPGFQDFPIGSEVSLSVLPGQIQLLEEQ